MADINIQALLTVNKSGSLLQGSGSLDITQGTSTKRNNVTVQNVPTTASAAVNLVSSTLSPIGYLFVKNLGTGTVSIGLANSGGGSTVANIFATLRANEFCLVPTPNVANIYANASVAGDVLVVAAEA